MPLNSLSPDDYDEVADSIESLIDLIADISTEPNGMS